MTALTMIFILVLASLLGAELISKVPQALHTPLMSGSNAISGITIIGAILVVGQAESFLAMGAGTVAVMLAMINVVGGFTVTDRMLRMFRKRGES